MSATVLHGDCIEVMRGLADASVDAIVTDPPYLISFMGAKWDSADGIAGKPDVWREALRVLKPGGHLLAFSATRTQHRMVCAIEDAGFEVRDQIYWHYGTGFPKSMSVDKAIDKAAGAERTEVVGTVKKSVASMAPGEGNFSDDSYQWKSEFNITAPATPEAQQWAGWGTALKPASEPICVARKPLIGTVAANVLEHGTGAINIDECRVGTTDKLGGGDQSIATKIKVDGWDRPWMHDDAAKAAHADRVNANVAKAETLGRWPANVIHDGSDEVLAAFAAFTKPGDGNPARFFYSAKASKVDRAGSSHPTVKPIALMRYLCKLVTPPGGTVLDMFAGSGTTLQAALEEGFHAIGIEREAEYHADILRRLEVARKAMEKPAPKPKAIRVTQPKKAPKTDYPTLFDLMVCESA